MEEKLGDFERKFEEQSATLEEMKEKYTRMSIMVGICSHSTFLLLTC